MPLLLHCSPCNTNSAVFVGLTFDCMTCRAQAMGQLCTKGQLSAAALQQVTACLLGILGAHAEGSQGPEESAPASRLFFAVLRTLQAVLLQVLPLFTRKSHQLSLLQVLATPAIQVMCSSSYCCCMRTGEGGAPAEPGLAPRVPESLLGIWHPALGRSSSLASIRAVSTASVCP